MNVMKLLEIEMKMSYNKMYCCLRNGRGVNTVKAKRRIAGLLAACMAMSVMLCGGASADSVTVTADKLNVREAADSSSRTLGVVRRGDELSFVSKVGSWYQVKFDRRLGFVMENYVDIDLAELEADVAQNTEAMSAAGRTTERVNIRELPEVDSKIVKVAPKKGKVEIIGRCGAWYQVKYDGKTGYLMGDYLELIEEPVQTPAPTPSPEATAEPTPAPEATAAPVQPEEPDRETIYDAPVSGRTNARVNMREGASTKDKIVKVLGDGETVSILGELDGWYKVSAGGKEGYVIGECVEQIKADGEGEEDKPSGSDETVYPAPVVGVATARVNMRKSPSVDAKIVKVIGNGQSVTIEGENGGWYKVTSDGREGYVSKSYLIVKKDEGGETVTPDDGFVGYPAERSGTVTARVNMRKSASTSASILKVLSEGAKVTVTGEQGDFYQVQSGGKSGYIARAYVRLAPADSEEAQPEDEKIYSAAKNGMTTVSVNMRAEPEGKILHTLSADTLVTLIGERGSWYKVSYKNDTGYISKSYVKERDGLTDTDGEGTKAWITATSVNMRKGPGTKYGVIRVLRRGAEIQYYAISEGWYLIKAGSDTGYVSADYVSTANPDGDSGEEEGKIILSDWFKGEIQDVLKRGDEGVITDVKTGLKFRFTRTGGYYHADAQPSTSGDTEIMFRIYGNKWKWDRRAIWVTVDGKTYAASMNGMPHGETDSITGNNFDGCFCIHFLNSKTHAGDRVDSAHQECVQEAYKAGKK